MISSERTKKRKIKNEIDYTLNAIYGKSNNIFHEVSPSVNSYDNNSESLNTVPNVLPPTVSSPNIKVPDIILSSTYTSNTCPEELSDNLCDNVGECSIIQQDFS